MGERTTLERGWLKGAFAPAKLGAQAFAFLWKCSLPFISPVHPRKCDFLNLPHFLSSDTPHRR
jgi:hypothetical protein